MGHATSENPKTEKVGGESDPSKKDPIDLIDWGRFIVHLVDSQLMFGIHSQLYSPAKFVKF